VFDLLNIDQMQAAQGALRHGVLYDLIDREQEQTDLRSTTVARLATKFATDTAQSQRVSQVACHLFKQLRSNRTPKEATRIQRKLQWAAQLHEIGSLISHSDYHKHGAYILDNADAPGFALPELHRLSQLVLGHRGKLRKLELNIDDHLFIEQLMCLRLGVLLCHARLDPDLKGLQLSADDPSTRSFVLKCRNGWASAFPQSAYLLNEEVLAWQKTPWTLAVQAA